MRTRLCTTCDEPTNWRVGGVPFCWSHLQEFITYRDDGGRRELRITTQAGVGGPIPPDVDAGVTALVEAEEAVIARAVEKAIKPWREAAVELIGCESICEDPECSLASCNAARRFRALVEASEPKPPVTP